jgi:hypothetical protein
MQSRPEEIARYTVEQNGGEYRASVPDLLALFGRKQLTDSARHEIRDALARQQVGTDPDLSEIRRSDVVRLFLLESQQIGAAPIGADSVHSTTPSAWRRRLRPRTWKGWLAYSFAALLILAALTGDSKETQEAASRGEAVERQAGGVQTDKQVLERRARAALRRERERLNKERARVRRERAQARHERARARKAQASAHRERQRQQELEAQAAQAAPEPEPAASCHPSYDPCLDPNASDYDCEGGSGDGPEYTGFVTVKGPDDYDLDSDGDGTGCE